MKYLMILIITFVAVAFQGSTFDDFQRVEPTMKNVLDIEIAPLLNVFPVYFLVNEICSEGEICSCIAAGSCFYEPRSEGCRIEFCSKNVVTGGDKTAPGGITLIQYPCEENGEG